MILLLEKGISCMIQLKGITDFFSKSNILSEFCCYRGVLYLYTSYFLLSDGTNQSISQEIFLGLWVEHKNRLWKLYNLFPGERSLKRFPLLTDIAGNVFFKLYKSVTTVIRNRNGFAVVAETPMLPLLKGIDFPILSCIISRHWEKSTTQWLFAWQSRVEMLFI